MGLSSTVTAQTLDHPQLDIPGQSHRSSNVPKDTENKTKSSFPCPEPTAIAPCICSVVEALGVKLDCSGVESDAQLADVFLQEFPLKQYYQFFITDNGNIQYLLDVFNGVTFEYIYFQNVEQLKKISNYVFFGSRDTLETIYIYNSALDENTFPFSTLTEFSRLTSLTLSFSNINVWPLFNSSSITSIKIEEEPISTLPASKKYFSQLLCSIIMI